jgi:hypothetical protein
MTLFLWAYVAGVLSLFRGAGRSSALAGFAIAALLCATTLQSGKVLGELPAAAFILWAAVAFRGGQLAIGGLLVGLAIQAKLTFGLAGVALFFAITTLKILGVSGISLRAIAVAGLMMVIPSLFFEIFRYFSTNGFDFYLYSLNELRSFLVAQNVNTFGSWLEPGLLGSKLVGLYSTLSKGGWLSLFIGGFLVLLFFAISGYDPVELYNDNRNADQSTEWHELRLKAAIIGVFLLLGGVGLLLGWITQSTQSGARQGLPFILVGVPPIMLLAMTRSFDFDNKSRFGASLALATVIVVLFSTLSNDLISKIFDVAAENPGAELDEQRKVVEIIKRERPESIFVDGWWQSPEYQLLADVTGTPMRTGRSQLLVVQDYQVKLLRQDWELYEKKCGRHIYRSPANLVCWLPEFEYRDVEFRVVDWGPRNAKIKEVPNKQNDGGVGLWVKIEKVNSEETGPVRIFFGGRPSRMDYLHSDGEVVTASIPPEFYNAPGRYEITLIQTTTGRNYHVGDFVVE